MYTGYLALQWFETEWLCVIVHILLKHLLYFEEKSFCDLLITKYFRHVFVIIKVIYLSLVQIGVDFIYKTYTHRHERLGHHCNKNKIKELKMMLKEFCYSSPENR